MGILGKLLGSDSVIKAGISGIDALVYTDQEKSESKKAFLKLYEPFKVGQRYISLVCVVPYTSAWFVTFLASFFIDVSPQLDLLKGDMGMIVTVIIGFYFAGGVVDGGFRKK